MRPDVSIVVPLDGGPDQALRCLEGLARQADGPPHEVIIVDNASVGLESLLARLDGDVVIVRAPARLGFAAAVRAGVARAAGETIVVLRDAAAPADGWLSPLVSALEDPAVGVATSVAADAAGTHVVTADAFAVRRGELDAAGLPDVADQHVVGALALGLSGRGLQARPVAASRVMPRGRRSVTARRAPGEPPVLTVVIPTLDAASERVRRCIAAVQATTEDAHEIVLVDNGSPPQGFSGPVNVGLRAARTPYVVVMNDDVEPTAGWWPPLREALDAGAAVSFPLTVDGGMRYDFAAWCFAMSAATVETFGHAPGEFFDPDLVIWYQDTDLLHRLRRAGTPPVFVEASRIRHGLSESVASEDPALTAWVQEQVMRDRAHFVTKHPDAVLDGHALAS